MTRFDTMIQTKKNKFSILSGEWNQLIPFKIDRFTDSFKGIEICVSGTQGNTKNGFFLFDICYGYRNFDEGDVLLSWQKSGMLSSGLYEAKNTDFLDWAREQSPYKALPRGLSNYLFVSINDVVDILAFDPPRFIISDT